MPKKKKKGMQPSSRREDRCKKCPPPLIACASVLGFRCDPLSLFWLCICSVLVLLLGASFSSKDGVGSWLEAYVGCWDAGTLGRFSELPRRRPPLPTQVSADN
jgi:hypothetical protein